MLVIGHRGAPNLSIENTIDSFNKAFENGVDGIELDIQLTRDKKIAVFHDFNTHSLDKKNTALKDIDLFELQDISSGFSIPTLEDVFKIIPKDKELHIEIKSNQINNDYIIDQTAKLTSKYGYTNQTIISSFNPFILKKIKQTYPEQRIGALWSKSKNTPWFVTHQICEIVKPFSFHASIKYFDQFMANWVKAQNLKLYFYTVNNKADLNKAISFQADGIFSDNPQILSKFRY
tara:strand:+ start:2432 stop:3130 length:699 start_codon:yes stop_codon:yes gene_type:complete